MTVSASDNKDHIIQTTSVKSGNVKLHVVCYGDSHNTPIVLVHGYPDSSQVWAPVATILAKHFFVITYDVRGAGLSDAPKNQDDYKIDILATDLAAVVDTIIPTRPFHLAAHDWGSIQTWESVTTDRLRSRIISYSSISGPSLDHMGHWLKDRIVSFSPAAKLQVLAQAASSWYIGLFHLPVIAPLSWQLGFGKLWAQYLTHREGVQTPIIHATQIADGKQGVNLYRANFKERLFKPQARYASCPVQIIVPLKDNYVGTHLFEDLQCWVPELYRIDLNAGHWVLLSDPQMIATTISRFALAVTSGKMPTTLQHRRVRGNQQNSPLSRKVAVITGAGSGIGRATALKFAEAGATIVAADINQAGLDRTVILCQALGAQAWRHVVDVASEDAMIMLATWVEQELGGADIVVNNAGIGMAGCVLETNVKDWRKILDVNLWGVIHGSRLFAAQMIKNYTAGHIVNIASAAAFAPNRKLLAYSTSKAAVHMFTECLRADLYDNNIGVTSVCPGFVATGIAQATVYTGMSDLEQAKQRAKADKLYKRRNFSPDDVADAVLNAVLNNPALSLVGTEAVLTRSLSRFAPSLSRLLAKLDIVA